MSTAAIASTGAGGAPQAGSSGSGGQQGGSSGFSAASSGVAALGWGDDWRVRMAGGSSNEKEIKQLDRYESPEQVWRKARELESRLSSGELRPVLGKNATADEQAAYRKAHGIPDTPEAYKVNMPVGREAPKDDDAFLKGFLASAHQNLMTQEMVDASIGSFYAEVDRLRAATIEEEQAAVQKTEDALRQEWGADYRANKAMADALLARAPAGFRDRFMNGYLDDHTPIKGSPEAWKWLVQMEREINPAATVVPGVGANVGKTIADEITSLKAMMGDSNSAYWKGPTAAGNQKRYRELLDVQQRLAQKASV